MRKIKWTAAAITSEARKYDSKQSFMIGCKSAYNACHSYYPGLIDELFYSNTQWDEAGAKAAMYECQSRREFAKTKQVAYKTARKLFPELLDEVLPRKNKKWDEVSIMADAKNYTSKSDYFYARTGGYAAALRSYPGLLDEIFGNKITHNADNDAIYIWKAVGQYYNGNPVYKIGVTSARLGTKRIEQCAGKWGFEFELICCEAVQCKATDLEKKLLILGEDPQFQGVDGYSEFRALSDSALYAAVSMICGAL